MIKLIIGIMLGFVVATFMYACKENKYYDLWCLEKSRNIKLKNKLYRVRKELTKIEYVIKPSFTTRKLK